MKIGSSTRLAFACAALSMGHAVVAAEAEPTKNTAPMSEKEVHALQLKTQTLINILIQKGIIDADMARQLNASSEPAYTKADLEAAKKNGMAEVVPQSQKDAPPKTEPNVIRVPYVSKQVRDQIRNDVQANVEKNVLESVMKKAETERWGVPNSWPSWLTKVKLSGDIRFRYEAVQFAEDNAKTFYLDTLAVNKAGGVIPAGQSAFINTTVDSDKLRLRARFGINVAVAPEWELGLRLASGSGTSPVSTNFTLSNYMSDSAINLDRAYVAYKTPAKEVQVWAGRFANPFLSTDLVWDDDINFGGLAASYAPWRANMSEGGIDPYLTVGIFPIEQVELSSQDKWLYGAQTGFNYEWENQNLVKFAVAYYDYENIEGQLNTFGSNLLDFTAPKFAQKGNTLFDIRNDDKTTTDFAGLASDYNQVDITVVYDIANFAPTRIIFTADYVRNLGFNARENLLAYQLSSGLNLKANEVQENVDAYSLEVMVGWPKISKRADWNVAIAYKNIGADAVLDAFTDSDFHLGGTDAAGYVISAQYGLADNVGLRLRLLSANEINDAPLAVDTWQLDLNVKF